MANQRTIKHSNGTVYNIKADKQSLVYSEIQKLMRAGTPPADVQKKMDELAVMYGTPSTPVQTPTTPTSPDGTTPAPFDNGGAPETPAAELTPITEQKWFKPVIIGGSALAVVGILAYVFRKQIKKLIK